MPCLHGCQTLESTRRLLRVYEFTSVPRVNSIVNSFLSKLGADSVDSEWTRANSRVWSELREFSWKKNPQNNIIFTVNHFRDLLPFPRNGVVFAVTGLGIFFPSCLLVHFFFLPQNLTLSHSHESSHRRVGGQPCYVGRRNT